MTKLWCYLLPYPFDLFSTHYITMHHNQIVIYEPTTVKPELMDTSK
jgi:hypothetical protein